VLAWGSLACSTPDYIVWDPLAPVRPCVCPPVCTSSFTTPTDYLSLCGRLLALWGDVWLSVVYLTNCTHYGLSTSSICLSKIRSSPHGVHMLSFKTQSKFPVLTFTYQRFPKRKAFLLWWSLVSVGTLLDKGLAVMLLWQETPWEKSLIHTDTYLSTPPRMDCLSLQNVFCLRHTQEWVCLELFTTSGTVS
jgi:hypothetical protein